MKGSIIPQWIIKQPRLFCFWTHWFTVPLASRPTWPQSPQRWRLRPPRRCRAAGWTNRSAKSPWRNLRRWIFDDFWVKRKSCLRIFWKRNLSNSCPFLGPLQWDSVGFFYEASPTKLKFNVILATSIGIYNRSRGWWFMSCIWTSQLTAVCFGDFGIAKLQHLLTPLILQIWNFGGAVC